MVLTAAEKQSQSISVLFATQVIVAGTRLLQTSVSLWKPLLFRQLMLSAMDVRLDIGFSLACRDLVEAAACGSGLGMLGGELADAQRCVYWCGLSARRAHVPFV